MLYAVPPRLLKGVEAVAQDFPFAVEYIAPCNVWVRRSCAPCAAKTENSAFAYRPLEPADAALINTRWTYGGTPEKEAYIRGMIRHCTTLGATRAAGQDSPLVAWVLQQDYGPIGMLHTEPEVRRQGVGLATASRLSDVICANRLAALRAEGLPPPEAAAASGAGDDEKNAVAELKSGECDPRPLAVGSRVLPPLPFAYIVRTNAASEALFTKAGFAPVVQAEWCMLSPT